MTSNPNLKLCASFVFPSKIFIPSGWQHRLIFRIPRLPLPGYLQSSGIPEPGESIAIVGGTGAGKSTILDAITLALYGKAPRYAKDSKASRAVMSFGTSDSMAEVLFETNEGTFLACWSMRRAHNQLAGKLQEPARTLSRWAS